LNLLLPHRPSWELSTTGLSSSAVLEDVRLLGQGCGDTDVLLDQ
jgi:hypothetical protein